MSAQATAVGHFGVPFISSFSVDRLGGRESTLSHKLNLETNVLWGLNGSGKTSLLKILHSGLINDARILARVPFERAEIVISDVETNTDVHRTIIKSEILERFVGLDTDEIVDFEIRTYGTRTKPYLWKTDLRRHRAKAQSRLVSKREEMSRKFPHGYLPISRVTDDVKPRRPRGLVEEVDEQYLDTLFGSQVRDRWRSYNTKGLEDIEAIQQQGIGEILSILFGGIKPRRVPLARRSAKDVASAYRLVTGFLENQKIAVDFDSNSFSEQLVQDEKLELILAIIEDVAEKRSEALLPQHELTRVIERLYSGNKSISLTNQGIEIRIGKNGRIPVEQLSSGERQLLHILLETMTAGSNPVIIDEPELSMHVDWQRDLVDSMHAVNRDCQIILATHSPEVMALVPDESIFEL